jgi:hypothetical protein
MRGGFVGAQHAVPLPKKTWELPTGAFPHVAPGFSLAAFLRYRQSIATSKPAALTRSQAQGKRAALHNCLSAVILRAHGFGPKDLSSIVIGGHRGKQREVLRPFAPQNDGLARGRSCLIGSITPRMFAGRSGATPLRRKTLGFHGILISGLGCCLCGSA